jgi:hypothetical protein
MALNAQNVTSVLMLFVWAVAGAQSTPRVFCLPSEERFNADLGHTICSKCQCVPWQISLKLRAQSLPR